MAATKTSDVRATRDHIDKTFKAGKCQLCGTKTPVASQFRIVSDLDNLKAKKLKGAKAGESHYCGDCAEKRQTARQTWIDNVYAGGNGKSKTKPAKKATPKGKRGSATPKAKKTAAKKPAKKPAKAKAAPKEEDPF